MKAAAFLFFLLPQLYLGAQGPISGFLPGAGNLDLALTYGQETYRVYRFGNESRAQDLSTRAVDLFVEYGISDPVSLVFTMPYQWIDPVNRGLQDGSVHLKFQNIRTERSKGKFSALTAVGLSFPLSNYPTDTETPIGQKALTFNTRFNLQYQWYSGPFLFLQSGLDFRLAPTALASLPTLLRMGYAGKVFYLDGWIEHYYTFNAGVDERLQGGTGSTWWRVGGTFYVGPLPWLGAFVNVAKILDGRNIGLSLRWGTGLVWKIRKKRG